MPRPRLPLILLAGAIVALIFYLITASIPAVRRTPAPDFDFGTRRGSLPASLSDLHGKVVVLDFWASWCGPCRTSMPHLEELYEQYRDRGLVVVGISLDDPAYYDIADRVKEQLHISYPTAFLHEIPGLEQKYDFRQIPAVYVIDRYGDLRDREQGYDPRSQVPALVEQLLHE